MNVRKLANGDLLLTAGNATRAWLAEQRDEQRNFWSTLADLFEPYFTNGSYEPFEPSDGERYHAPFVGLTSAPCIAESLSYRDDGFQEIEGDHWWFPNYAISCPLEDLRRRGRTVFQNAKNA